MTPNSPTVDEMGPDASKSSLIKHSNRGLDMSRCQSSARPSQGWQAEDASLEFEESKTQLREGGGDLDRSRAPSVRDDAMSDSLRDRYPIATGRHRSCHLYLDGGGRVSSEPLFSPKSIEFLRDYLLHAGSPSAASGRPGRHGGSGRVPGDSRLSSVVEEVRIRARPEIVEGVGVEVVLSESDRVPPDAIGDGGVGDGILGFERCGRQFVFDAVAGDGPRSEHGRPAHFEGSGAEHDRRPAGIVEAPAAFHPIGETVDTRTYGDADDDKSAVTVKMANTGKSAFTKKKARQRKSVRFAPRDVSDLQAFYDNLSNADLKNLTKTDSSDSYDLQNAFKIFASYVSDATDNIAFYTKKWGHSPAKPLDGIVSTKSAAD